MGLTLAKRHQRSNGLALDTAPSLSAGDWPSYAADLRSTHYSPLAQVDASNFRNLEVAWRFKTDSLGPRPEFKLEGTRILYVTIGFRLVSLDAKTGAVVTSFGKSGIVDLKEAAVFGNRQSIDLTTGEIGVHSVPTVTREGVVLIGSSMREGGTPKTHNDTCGLRAVVQVIPDDRAHAPARHGVLRRRLG